jgi:hypothetical protein
MFVWLMIVWGWRGALEGWEGPDRSILLNGLYFSESDYLEPFFISVSADGWNW